MINRRDQYLKMIETMASNNWDTSELIQWMNDDQRKEAILSFTEGPARQVAYAFESAIKRATESTITVPPMTLRPTERCPRCGYTQCVKE